MNLYKLFFIAFIFSAQILFAQNLIVNGSFEDCNLPRCDCPNEITELAGSWQIITGRNRSDLKEHDNYYNECFTSYNTNNKAYDGKSYTWFTIWNDADSLKNSKRRFLFQTYLKEQLNSGATYKLFIFYRAKSWRGKMDLLPGNVSVGFSHKNLKSIYSGSIYGMSVKDYFPEADFSPVATNNHIIITNEWTDWQRIEGNFIADGTERYLLIYFKR